MSVITELKDKIFSVQATNFDDLALEVFYYQASKVAVYREYLSYLGIKPASVKKVAQIPFLPVSLFKSHEVIAEGQKASLVFESSGTTGMQASRHLVADPGIYEESILKGFEMFFGRPDEFTFLSLLPSYLEREGSSLAYMMELLHGKSGSKSNGFYLYEHEKLHNVLEACVANKEKIFFTGVSFALIDFADAFPLALHNTILMETGGMKGRRKEIIREELYDILKPALGLEDICSEYGMTELLSQAYALKDGIFKCPPWMRIHIREASDPFSWVGNGQTGGISIIDLANLHSCSFIATQDLGRKAADGSFEVLGRFDNADIRGCSLLYS